MLWKSIDTRIFKGCFLPGNSHNGFEVLSPWIAYPCAFQSIHLVMLETMPKRNLATPAY